MARRALSLPLAPRAVQSQRDLLLVSLLPSEPWGLPCDPAGTSSAEATVLVQGPWRGLRGHFGSSQPCRARGASCTWWLEARDCQTPGAQDDPLGRVTSLNIAVAQVLKPLLGRRRQDQPPKTRTSGQSRAPGLTASGRTSRTLPAQQRELGEEATPSPGCSLPGLHCSSRTASCLPPLCQECS